VGFALIEQDWTQAT